MRKNIINALRHERSYIKFDCVSLLHSPLAFCGTLSKSERMLSHIGHDIAKHTVNIC